MPDDGDYDDSSSCRGSDEEDENAKDQKIMTDRQQRKRRNRAWEDEDSAEDSTKDEEEEDEEIPGDDAMPPPQLPMHRNLGKMMPPPPKKRASLQIPLPQQRKQEQPSEDDAFLDDFLDENEKKDSGGKTDLDSFLDGIMKGAGLKDADIPSAGVGKKAAEGEDFDMFADDDEEEAEETEQQKLEKILKEKGLSENSDGGVKTRAVPEWGLNMGFGTEKKEPQEPPPLPTPTSNVHSMPTMSFDMFGDDDCDNNNADGASSARAAALKEQGNAFVKRREFSDAVQCYTEALELNGCEEHLLLSNRSNAYLSLKLYKKAYVDAATCVQSNPSWFKGYLRKALILKEIGCFTDANAVVREGLEHASDALSRAALQGCLCEGKPDEKNEKNEFLTSKRTHAASGTAFFKQKEYSKATREYTTSLKTDPSDISLLLNRAACFNHLRNFTAALADAQAAQKMSPKHPKAYLRLAVAYKGLNRMPDAQHAVGQGLELHPSDKALGQLRSEMNANIEKENSLMASLFK